MPSTSVTRYLLCVLALVGSIASAAEHYVLQVTSSSPAHVASQIHRLHASSHSELHHQSPGMCSRNRYYDPKTGAFNNIDPIGFNGGLNLYGYCSGDPTNRSDPMGTDWQLQQHIGDGMWRTVDTLPDDDEASANTWVGGRADRRSVYVVGTARGNAAETVAYRARDAKRIAEEQAAADAAAARAAIAPKQARFITVRRYDPTRAGLFSSGWYDAVEDIYNPTLIAGQMEGASTSFSPREASAHISNMGFYGMKASGASVAVAAGIVAAPYIAAEAALAAEYPTVAAMRLMDAASRAIGWLPWWVRPVVAYETGIDIGGGRRGGARTPPAQTQTQKNFNKNYTTGNIKPPPDANFRRGSANNQRELFDNTREGEPKAYLYQKVGPKEEHLKFGVTDDLSKRYTSSELSGGRLRKLAEGSRDEMLQLERQLHSTLPLGPEERQRQYFEIQLRKGYRNIWNGEVYDGTNW
jgi:RHS repeat-associated protein